MDVGVYINGLMVLVTLAIALVAWWTFKSQTGPKIIVYTHQDYLRPGFIKIRIHNIGKDVAKDVSFEMEKDNPIPDVQGPLLTGLPSLAPGEYRESRWGMLAGNNPGFTEKVSGGIFAIKYRYHQDRTFFPGKKTLRGEDIVEVDSYIGKELIVLSPHNDIIKAMEKWHLQLILTLKAALAARDCDDSEQ